MSDVFARPSSELRPSRIAVSALFDSADAIEHALARLHGAGVPRDLIEVIVSADAAKQFYPGQRFASQREVFRFAGIGGLTGLILGAGISLVMLIVAGETSQRLALFIQLLGPNMLTICGALLGAVYGALRRRRPPPHYARAAERSGAILLVVRAKTPAESDSVSSLLSGAGGRDVRVDVAH